MGKKVRYQKNLGGNSEQEFFGWDRNSWVASGKDSPQYFFLLYCTGSSTILRVNDLGLEETFLTALFPAQRIWKSIYSVLWNRRKKKPSRWWNASKRGLLPCTHNLWMGEFPLKTRNLQLYRTVSSTATSLYWTLENIYFCISTLQNDLSRKAA